MENNIEINLSKITSELIRELNKDPNIHNILVKEGVVLEKPKLEVGKWYKADGNEKSLICFQGYWNDNVYSYGFGILGYWTNTFGFWKDKYYTEATPTEVIERLKAEAVKRGFVEGVRFKTNWFGEDEFNIFSGGELRLNQNSYGYNTLCECGTPWIMKNGIWAEIYTEPSPAYIQVPISEIDSLSSKKLGKLVKKIRKSQD